jgi:hypothetical protein
MIHRTGLWGKTHDVLRKEGLVPAEPPPVLTPNLDLPTFAEGTGRLTPQTFNYRKEVTMDPNTADIVSQFKKGYRTTEFWQSLIPTLLPVLTFGAALFGFDVDGELLVASLGGLVPNLAYIGGRTWLKRKRLDTVAPYETVE